MSKPRYRWWGFVRKMIRDYPALKKQWEELHTQSISVEMTGMPKGTGVGRGVEAIALQQLPRDDQDAYDAVTRAVELTKLRPDGKERLALIRYVYWYEKRHLIKDAAYKLHISEDTAKEWHGEFVRLVGKCYGFQLKYPPECQESML